MVIINDSAVVFGTGRPLFNRGGVYSININNPFNMLNWFYRTNQIANGTTPLITNEIIEFGNYTIFLLI